ncbi:MAG: transglycosylase SLT domain-containing protein, partial [Dehalococcoidia bacterium]
EASESVRLVTPTDVTSRLLELADSAAPQDVYRAAVEARDQGAYEVAAALFELVGDSSGPLVPFARFRAAQMTSLTGEHGAAADAYATLLGEDGTPSIVGDLPSAIRSILLVEAASAFDRDGRTASALAALEQVDAVTSNSFTLADARWRRASILHDQADPRWQDAARDAMTTAPGSGAARNALDLLEEEGAEVPEFTAANVEYRAYRNESAQKRYLDLLGRGALDASQAAQAWFYIGALQERSDLRSDAIASYSRSLLFSESGGLADDARYWRGRVLEELGRPQDAAVEYDLLVRDYPTSSFIDDARLRAAVALGLVGSGQEATARLAEITRSGSPSAAAKASHWHTVLVNGFGAPAADVLPPAAFDPSSYAAVFAAGGDAIVGPLPASAAAERPQPIADDSDSVKVWLGGYATHDAAATTAMMDDSDVALAWELLDAGEGSVARSILNTVVSEYRDEPYDLVDMAFEARRRGLHDIAMASANGVLRNLDPHQRLEAPPALLAIAYPLPYLEEATAAADEFGIPVLLLYSLVRQESAFFPLAGSSVGAFGLTQVMEPTSQYIASDLKMPEFRFDDLSDPATALRFGAYYLAVQLDQFDGHMLAALAAYNGGPGNASRWLKAQTFGGPDGFLYAVDYTETRAYLEVVSANYAVYRYLYAGVDTPALPH